MHSCRVRLRSWVGLDGALVKLFRTVELLAFVSLEAVHSCRVIGVLAVGLDGALVKLFRTVDILALVAEEVHSCRGRLRCWGRPQRRACKTLARSKSLRFRLGTGIVAE